MSILADDQSGDEGPAGPDQPRTSDHIRSPTETEARGILRRRSGAEEPVLQSIERQIDMTLEHLDEVRSVSSDLGRDLSRAETRVQTDLLRFTPRPYINDPANPNHFFNDSPRRALKNRLEDLAKERRTLGIDLRARQRALLERLAALVDRHGQVRGSGGV